MIFSVDNERFYQEYQNNVQNEPNNHINWFVDERDIHMYIVTGAVIFFYKTNKKEMSQLLEGAINKKGMILGVAEPRAKVVEKQSVISFVENRGIGIPDKKA